MSTRPFFFTDDQLEEMQKTIIAAAEAFKQLGQAFQSRKLEANNFKCLSAIKLKKNKKEDKRPYYRCFEKNRKIK